MEFNKINTLGTSSSPLISGILSKDSTGEAEKFDRLLENAKNEKNSEQLEKACRDLEGVFVSMVFKQMNNSIQKGGLIDEGYAGGVFREMLSEKYAEEASKGEGMGIAKVLFKQLSQTKLNEV